MEPVIKRVRARVRGRHLELLEDVDLPADREVNVGIEMPSEAEPGIAEALRASGGAWFAEVHLELKTREDAVLFVRGLRAVSTAGYERELLHRLRRAHLASAQWGSAASNVACYLLVKLLMPDLRRCPPRSQLRAQGFLVVPKVLRE